MNRTRQLVAQQNPHCLIVESNFLMVKCCGFSRDDQLQGAARSSTLPLKRAWTGKEPPTINTIFSGGVEYWRAEKGETAETDYGLLFDVVSGGNSKLLLFFCWDWRIWTVRSFWAPWRVANHAWLICSMESDVSNHLRYLEKSEVEVVCHVLPCLGVMFSCRLTPYRS